MFSMGRILLPIDFSDRTMGAARYVEALAEHHGSEAVMLHVVPHPYYEFTGMEAGGVALNDLYVNRAKQLQQECDSFLSKELPKLQARRVMLEGDPARLIVRYAHDERCDLIVMPTHGYGPFRRFVLGSVTAKVLHDADCAVWTGVHMEDAPPVEQIVFRTVVAALDLGAQSERALTWAARFACNWKARLVIVHATYSLEGHAGEYFDPDWRLHLVRSAGETIQQLQERVGAQAEVVIEAGDAPGVVCDAARRHAADLLVIGRGSAAGVFGRLRANAYSIIRQSPCPVVSV
jgi:nucleotide-binding universal stress UspA family protein